MYELHHLGWYNFQKLVRTILREVMGQSVESYLDGNDGGRDGAFAGVWKNAEEEALSGRFVIQCKHTSKPGYNLQPSDLADEIPKAARLVAEGRCDCYLLFTNAGVSGTVNEALETEFRNVGVKEFRSFASTWICEQIQTNKQLRMLVPRLYGLGDLTQILDSRQYLQAEALLESLGDELSKVVVTNAYQLALAALEQHRFVLLIGEPAAGKTTIASLLAMAAIDQWDALPMKLNSPDSVLEHWDPEEPSQFFWIDDAFGVTQYQSHLVQGWNQSFNHVKAMLKKDALVVMTSRDYIYNRARDELKESAFPLMQESNVVIDVRDLESEERQQILYNHIKLGTQRNSFRTAIKPFLEGIAGRERFIPETARRLGDPIFTKNLEIYKSDLAEFVDKQEALLQEVIRGLDEDHFAALALIFMRNDRLTSPIDLHEYESESLERLSSKKGHVLTALRSLNGGLVRHINQTDDSYWQFKHPTIGDAFSQLLTRDPELLGIYVQGTETGKLLRQVTCGHVGLDNAVVLGKRFYPEVINRLDTMADGLSWRDSWRIKHRVDGFLARRCSKDFLSLYLDMHPEILERIVNPGLSLDAVSEVDVAIRFHEVGLLPDDQRRVFVNTVTDYAVEGDDVYALWSEGIQSVFVEDEYVSMVSRVRDELIPRLDEVRSEWQSHFGESDDSAEDHMQHYLESIDTLTRAYPADDDVAKVAKRERERAYEWIAEQEDEDNQHKASPTRRAISAVDPTDGPIVASRSIFDDIDE